MKHTYLLIELSGVNCAAVSPRYTGEHWRPILSVLLADRYDIRQKQQLLVTGTHYRRALVSLSAVNVGQCMWG